jgi:hypothetical protein
MGTLHFISIEGSAPMQLPAIRKAKNHYHGDIAFIAQLAIKLLDRPFAPLKPLADAALHQLGNEIDGLQNGTFACAVHSHQTVEFAELKGKIRQGFEILDDN